MSFHIRVRPTALIIENEQVLLIEYKDEHGVHYNLPGGGAEPGETLIEGVLRELYEETMVQAEAGPIAFVYEFAPHKQSGDYDSEIHTVYIVFECSLKAGVTPGLPDQPDSDQTAVRWIPLAKLNSVILYPNIKDQIKRYVHERRNIEIIEDYRLESYASQR